jgi:hypothetical protein
MKNPKPILELLFRQVQHPHTQWILMLPIFSEQAIDTTLVAKN